jgi:hypothetical protein
MDALYGPHCFSVYKTALPSSSVRRPPGPMPLVGMLSSGRARVGNCALGSGCTVLLGLNGQGEVKDAIANQGGES